MNEVDKKQRGVATTLIGAKRLVEDEVQDIGMPDDSKMPKLLIELVGNVLRPHVMATRDGRSLRDQRSSMVQMVHKAFDETDEDILGSYADHRKDLIGFCIECIDKVLAGEHLAYMDT